MNLYELAVAKALSGSGGGGEPVIEALSVTENGTYTAPSGVDGYSPVTVNVSGGGEPTLLATVRLEDMNITQTTATSTGGTFRVPLEEAKLTPLIMVVVKADSQVADHHYATISYLYAQTDGDPLAYGDTTNYYADSSNKLNISVNTSSYGFYPSLGSKSGGKRVVNIMARYSNTYTKTIDNDYAVEVYGILPPGIQPIV